MPWSTQSASHARTEECRNSLHSVYFPQVNLRGRSSASSSLIGREWKGPRLFVGSRF